MLVADMTRSSGRGAALPPGENRRHRRSTRGEADSERSGVSPATPKHFLFSLYRVAGGCGLEHTIALDRVRG
eukprot:6905322-Prymnesium_polylepis.2